jgi:hypothetical protein
MVDLHYNIATCRLRGNLAGITINVYAVSGGRAGTKTLGAENWWLSNNVFATHVKLNDHNADSVGGPLPQGLYKLSLHESKPNWIRLTPSHLGNMHGRNTVLPRKESVGIAIQPATNSYGRAGFAIHGAGPRGSDGCIVIPDFSVLQQLCSLVENRQDNGGLPFVLKVYAEGQNLDKKLFTA